MLNAKFLMLNNCYGAEDNRHCAEVRQSNLLFR
jgi:hypothetical protein